MAVRETRPPCPTCPDKAQAVSQPRTLMVSTESEGMRLWNHALFGTNTCCLLLLGYVELNMPGDPLPRLYELRNLLDQTIKLREARNATHPAEKPSPDRPSVRVDG